MVTIPTDWSLISLETIDSTNLFAHQLIQEGKAKDRQIIWAKEQTKGRGRYNRKWESPKGNLFASFIFEQPSSKAPEMGFVTATALGSLFKKHGLSFEYKWPNDLLVRQKKIFGYLN